MTGAVLCVGGMDSAGQAGLLRDGATAMELSAAYRVAVTAVTAQNDARVSAVHPVPADVLAAQIALAVEAGIASAKTGMLVNRSTIEVVAANLPDVPLVVDPVLRSSSGHELLDHEGAEALLALLLPRTTVLTPNLPELAALARHLGLADAPEPQVVEALLQRGCAAVLVKGGHAQTTAFSEDRLYCHGLPPLPLRAPRRPILLRGTGCQLATAIAIGLATGASLEMAVKAAKSRVSARFEAALTPEPKCQPRATRARPC